MTKTCTRCGKTCPATKEYFYGHNGMNDGLRPDCKKCHKQQANLYYQAHKKVSLACSKQYRSVPINHLRQVYRDIQKRCNDPEHKDYKWYGGRGIRCSFKSADEFVNYVINKLQIDRIDNNGHYEPDNIQFVTAKVNNNNRRKRK